MPDASGDRFHGMELTLRKLSGAAGVRVVHPGGQHIGAHRHDWPYLALHRLGGYQERFEGGAVWIDRPSVVFHPAGGEHEDAIGPSGLETVTVEFDPAWIGRESGGPIVRSRVWFGGRAAGLAHQLVSLWSKPQAPEERLRAATAALLASLGQEETTPPEPAWMCAVRRALHEGRLDTAELARRLELHPAWLARAYRRITGEGLHETARRRRVERAIALLRGGDVELADAAVACGFSDQSHMTHVFRAMTGRTPLQVRRESLRLRHLTAVN